MLTDKNKATRIAMSQAMLSRDKGMNSAFFSSVVTMDETCMLIFNPETKQQLAHWKLTANEEISGYRQC